MIDCLVFYAEFNNCFVLLNHWVTYQFYWSIYPYTIHAVSCNANPGQPWAPRIAAITTICIVFGMTCPWIEHVTSGIWGRRSTTTPPWRSPSQWCKQIFGCICSWKLSKTLWDKEAPHFSLNIGNPKIISGKQLQAWVWFQLCCT